MYTLELYSMVLTYLQKNKVLVFLVTFKCYHVDMKSLEMESTGMLNLLLSLYLAKQEAK